MGECPPELSYLNNIKGAEVTLTLSDYRKLAAISRDDLILWNEAALQRAEDKAALDAQDRERS
jgi:hypothetical protein